MMDQHYKTNILPNHLTGNHDFEYLICTPGHVGTTFIESLLLLNNKKLYGTHLLIDVLSILQQTNKTIIAVMRDPIARNFSKFYTEISYGQHTGVKEHFHHHRLYNYYGPPKKIVMNFNKIDINKLFNMQKYHYLTVNWMEAFIKLIGIDITSFDKEKGMTIFNLKNNNNLVLLTTESLTKNKSLILKELNCNNVNDNDINQKKSSRNDPLWIKLNNDLEYDKLYLSTNLNHPIMKQFYTDKDIDKLKEKYGLINL